MSSAPVALLVVVLTLAVVLLTSGLAKLRDRQATRDAFDALRVPDVVPAGPAATALPWVEVALAALLLVAPAPWLVPVAVVVLLLMLAYAALVVRALGFDEPVACACFGSLGRHEVGRTTVARNVLLSLLSAVTLWWAATGGSAPGAAGGLDVRGWATLLACAAAVTVAVLVAGRGADSADDAEPLDYERQPTPYGVVERADGRTVTLAELTATQARLLVVLKPGCGPCVRTAEKLDGWAARLGPAVGVVAVYPDQPSAVGQTQHDADLAVVEPELNIRRVFSVGQPAAVLLGADGYLAGGPVAGEGSVARFVDDVLEAVSEQPSPSD
ncbi:putative membrane protein YphA (DoxX/SURF4 family)/thiol-disulfide isomerase/thioredoxin [Nocardioides cavernae]|uniref:Putative membrane protein YphA (DoxX/SURF4 family)/thiol-disulfide isomerase/thioredoxin n=1 Tax=Nocardioides cavernae TaxID=1921566 RepID=A0A7Y9H0X4_9ACTN|nr:thioredoxin family protein [Nocardioides cavernae]NYE35775.1 putative membrane protein YphA (DoxX/SURF4 family)/thiol-disulfide isomerase/thioredoxin [Nocardioides cavernae]